ncbi:MAG: hypothetical protein BTN85_0979 [Candidatus Methanohalarchaeum thermophilum]|uniref:Uncharacterized protein n=1 Tax=Methanohalarchaeum thermophilum TaxID=1903181 RepID=A0A1Q6DVX0_METT1|nr:MAG: hypothetical protein BTN85_0979 [Candidatus Methanohalarchaeum thermophilum]
MKHVDKAFKFFFKLIEKKGEERIDMMVKLVHLVTWIKMGIFH